MGVGGRCGIPHLTPALSAPWGRRGSAVSAVRACGFRPTDLLLEDGGCGCGPCSDCGKARRRRRGPWARAATVRQGCSACPATIPNSAARAAPNAPRPARPGRSRSAMPAQRRPGARSRLRALRRLPIVHRSLPDRRHGAVRGLGLWRAPARRPGVATRAPGLRSGRCPRLRPRPRLPPQPAHPPRRRRLVQRLRIRAAGAQQPVLQPAPARHLFYRLAAFCRFAAGHGSGDLRYASAVARRL